MVRIKLINQKLKKFSIFIHQVIYTFLQYRSEIDPLYVLYGSEWKDILFELYHKSHI